VPALSADDAIALFADRAVAANHRFSLKQANAAAISELCRRLDGFPLAIELAAARANVFSVESLVERLDDRFAILTVGDRRADARQRSMRATIDWSYDLLPNSERLVFERLSVFSGGCTLKAAQAVCSEEDDTDDVVTHVLASLVDKSLVIVDLEATTPRYSLLESFHEYAREKLKSRGEATAIALRHALATLALAEQIGAAISRDLSASGEAVFIEIGNVRAALYWALTQHGNVVVGQRLVGVAASWKSFTVAEARGWIDAALSLANERTPGDVLARLRLTEASVAGEGLRFEAAFTAAAAALDHYRTAGDPMRLARALAFAGLALTGLNRAEEGMPFLLEAVKVSRDSGNNRLMANLLREVALAMLRTGDVAGARGCAGESLGLLETGGRQDVPLSLNVLAECEFLAGDSESALERASEALALGHALRGKAADIRPMILSNTSRYLVALGRYAEATARSTESLALAMDLRFEVLIAWNLENLAAIATLASELAPERPSVTYENAARVFGFVNSRLAALGSDRDLTGQPQYNRAVAILNEALGAEAVTNLMTDGMSMTEREAI
ncbi:MAG TPA: hypothetical protein VGF86_12550, partial [Candidatus Tumulicola sp.]